MKKDSLKKFLVKRNIMIVIVLIILISAVTLFLLRKDLGSSYDNISYQGKTYVYMEYNEDIFIYNYNNPNNNYYEEDVIYPISNDRWDMIYSSGDLFVISNEVKDAKRYYANDNNYNWSVIIDDGDSEVEFPILISDEELDYLYEMENMKREETMTFDDIEKFGTLKKTSKDKMVYSIISLVYYKDYWYFKTEVMEESKNSDLEYIIELPKSLNEKILYLLRGSI